MTINGWKSQYAKLKKEFMYSEKMDQESAIILDSIIKKPVSLVEIKRILKGKTVFVIGAGPSLSSSIKLLKEFKNIPKVVADGAVTAMIENNIRPDIVVTDLDGDINSLKKLHKTKTIFIVHAHGDNIERLPVSQAFRNSLGTTQARPVGKIRNFGGFTDGDRCVFLARYFEASNIILVGMDFGNKIGRYSKTKHSERKIKLKKLRAGKRLLEWLASQDHDGLFTIGSSIHGFKTINFEQVREIIVT